MTSLALPARVLVDPVDGPGPVVAARRWLWPLLLLCFSVAASGVAFAVRWDPTPVVLRQQQAGPGAGAQTTESELEEEIQTTSRKALVGGIMKGVVGMPAFVLLVAAALWLAGWLFEARAPFLALFTAAAVAMLPIALAHLIQAVCALAQHELSLMRAATLVPSSLGALPGLSPKLRRVLGAVDLFRLWSVVMLGMGFSAATGMKRWKALVLVLGLYVMFAGVVDVGLPGMAEASAAGGRGGPRGGGR